MADDGSTPSPSQDFLQALEKWKRVRSPGPEHRLLERLAGEWEVTVRFHGGDTAFESRARASCRLVHGGRFLLEELSGEVHAPDETGEMRPELWSATRILGFDRYRNAWVGSFAENQNTDLLTFSGTAVPPGGEDELHLFGPRDEPMLDLRDTTMRYVLRVEGPSRHVWEVSALAAGGQRVFDFVYER